MDSDTQALVSGLVLCGLLSLPALRLLRRSGEERLVGLFFLASGIGFGARVAAVGDTGTSPVLNGLGHLGLSLACIALYRFTRSVFRPGARAGRIAEQTGIVASVVTLVAVLATGGVTNEQSLSVLAANAVRMSSYAWSFGEALRYWSMMQKRVGLGLADPIVSNRFGLWSIWMGGLTLMLGIVLVLRLLGLIFGLQPSMMSILLPQVLPLLRLLLASVALVTGTAVWLTFFPPRFYARRLQRSTG